MWFMAAFMKAFGFTSLAAKLPSAILGFSLVMLTYIFSRKMFGRIAGFLSAFVLLTTTQFLYYSRMSMLDVSSSFFITLSLAVYFLSKQKRSKWSFILAGVAIGLAVMLKGVVGFLPFVIISIYEFYLFFSRQQRLTKKLVINYALMFFSSLVVFLPWHIEMYRRFGDAFINNYIVYHVWDRATSAIEDKGRPFFWYLTVMKVSMRVWFIGLLAAFPLCLYKVLKRDNKFIFIFVWTLVVFLFFSAAKSKLIWYIMPVYPVVAIMVGYMLSKVMVFGAKFIHENFKELYKIVVVSIIVVASLFYLFLNRELVYTSDLTGSQARLLVKKDAFFGVEKTLYVDRVERPLSLYYSDGPFIDVDFNPQIKNRVPLVGYTEQLILLTKKGRYSEQVTGYIYKPQIVAEDGDWMLWYIDSGLNVDTLRLKATKEKSN